MLIHPSWIDAWQVLSIQCALSQVFTVEELYLDVVWVFLFVIQLATHEVGSVVAYVLEQLQGTGQSLLGGAALLHVSTCHLMRKLVL